MRYKRAEIGVILAVFVGYISDVVPGFFDGCNNIVPGISEDSRTEATGADSNY